ncbi:hypothetical protein, partial [Streptomyces sp. NPDC056308]
QQDHPATTDPYQQQAYDPYGYAQQQQQQSYDPQAPYVAQDQQYDPQAPYDPQAHYGGQSQYDPQNPDGNAPGQHPWPTGNASRGESE